MEGFFMTDKMRKAFFYERQTKERRMERQKDGRKEGRNNGRKYERIL
jgi:hypothetical protein